MPRRQPRQVVPAISMSIRVDFRVETRIETKPLHGRLWDVSLSGACLLFPTTSLVEIGHEGPITMHHPSVGTPIHSQARILWVDRLTHAVYAGALFTESINFETTFLRSLMRRNGQNPAPSQLGDLRDQLHDFPGFS
ncbi:PilZ domain-containing protein [Aphanothece stagnina]|uniref:PilZ domain-containing protein n=1 Tax=Aphanothece stagnina TaxID=1004305 RepID=UPI00398E55F8